MKQTDLPQHIAFIMDGNRRWARAHKFEIIMGHNTGAERIETVVEAAAKKDIPFVTFWAFSTENWNRNKIEVEMLFKVFRDVLSGSMIKRLVSNGVNLQVIGDYKAFPKDIVQGVEKLMKDSKNNTRITANIALNYGGRAEILDAVQRLLEEEQQYVIRAKAGIQVGKKKQLLLPGRLGDRSGMTLNEEVFSKNLYTAGQPDPDMIIRTGGEQRLSGFLPWQSVYSELYFTDVYWPDFDEKEFEKALEEYARRQRRFGK